MAYNYIVRMRMYILVLLMIPLNFLIGFANENPNFNFDNEKEEFKTSASVKDASEPFAENGANATISERQTISTDLFASTDVMQTFVQDLNQSLGLFTAMVDPPPGIFRDFIVVTDDQSGNNGLFYYANNSANNSGQFLNFSPQYSNLFPAYSNDVAGQGHSWQGLIGDFVNLQLKVDRYSQKVK